MLLLVNAVCCVFVTFVLRNNALTTLRGIENLKSLEGLDVSYNIISNFSELEFVAGLPYLQSLWLEGNPLCCARWYRAQVFSFFSYPERVSYIVYFHTLPALTLCLHLCLFVCYFVQYVFICVCLYICVLFSVEYDILDFTVPQCDF